MNFNPEGIPYLAYMLAILLTLLVGALLNAAVVRNDGKEDFPDQLASAWGLFSIPFVGLLVMAAAEGIESWLKGLLL